MIANSEIKSLLADTYHCKVVALTRLRGEPDAVPGVYHIRDTDGQERIIRIVERIHQLSLYNTGTLLHWLEQSHYATPRLIPPATKHCHNVAPQYGLQMLTYIAGAPISRSPEDLGLLATALGRLHALPLRHLPPVHSWWYFPDVLAETILQLHRARELVPKSYQALIGHLLLTVQQLMSLQPNGLIHGDCWYANAIRVSAQEAVLIDWDCAGLGATILDLGALLLTSHYDLTNPLHVAVTPQRIQAIMACYQAVRPIPALEQTYLAASIPFYLAFNAARYFAPITNIEDTALFQLQKLAARYAATSEIIKHTLQFLLPP